MGDVSTTEAHMRAAARDGAWHGDAAYVGLYMGRQIDELRESNRFLQAQIDLLARHVDSLLTNRPFPPQPRNQGVLPISEED